MKIFNWVGGSFFRTLGRFLFYILLGSLFYLFCSFLVIPNAYALERNYDWVINTKQIARGGIAQASNGQEYAVTWRSAGSMIFDSSGQHQEGILQDRTFMQMTNSDYLGPSGMTAFIQPLSIMRKDYLYAVSLYLCSSTNLLNANFTSYPQFDIDNAGIQTTGYTDLNRTIIYSLSTNGTGYPAVIDNYCYVYVNYMVTKEDANIWGIRLQSSPSIANTKLTLVGYDFVSMGYYNEAMKRDIQEAISTNMTNSATKQDVETIRSDIQQVQQEVEGIKDTMNNSDTSGANSDASGFFDNFQSNDHGLTGIITTPLNLINSITSKTCSPLNLPLPFVNENLSLPCMTPIYQQYFGDFYSIYETITFGIVAYWVCVRIFYKVQDFKNPSNSEVEVLEL